MCMVYVYMYLYMYLYMHTIESNRVAYDYTTVTPSTKYYFADIQVHSVLAAYSIPYLSSNRWCFSFTIECLGMKSGLEFSTSKHAT